MKLARRSWDINMHWEAGYGDGSTSAVSLVAAARKRGAPFQSDTKALSVLVVAGRVRGVARERLAWGGKLAGAYERPS